MPLMKRTWLGIAITLTLLAVGAIAGLAMRAYSGQAGNGSVSSFASAAASESPSRQVGVKTIHPKRDPSFVLSVKEPAYVEPYFRAELFSRVAVPVRSVQKDIGDPVSRDEVLVEIDVPDLDQQLAQM